MSVMHNERYCTIGRHSFMCTVYMFTAYCNSLSFSFPTNSRISFWPFVGFPCGLSEVDRFGAGMGHPVPSEFADGTEWATQPEDTRTGWGVFVGWGEWKCEWLSFSCVNCQQSVAVFGVFNNHTIQLSFLLATHWLKCSRHCIISWPPPQSEGVDRPKMQWVPCQGSCGGNGKETWCEETGCGSIQ